MRVEEETATGATAPVRRSSSVSGKRRAPALRAHRYDSWHGALWVVVIALDFFWLSDPRVLMPFHSSLRNAGIVTAVGLLLSLPFARRPRPAESVLGVVIFGFASVLWSNFPDVSFAFTADVVVVAAIATVAVACADARAVAHGMALGGVLVLAISVYAFATGIAGADVPLGTKGYLAGVGGNRNILAYTMLPSLAFTVSFMPRRLWGRLLWAGAAGALLVGIYLAQSGTGMVAAVMILCVAISLAVTDRRIERGARPGARRRWTARAIALGLVITGLLTVDLFGRLMGRDIGSLSGRVPLWSAIWNSTTGVDRWFGSGWGAVWPHGWEPAPTNTQFLAITERLGFTLYHGHSALFDLIPEIGLVGAAIFFLTYLQAAARGLALREPGPRSTSRRLQASRATLLGLLAVMLFGLTEPMSTIPLGWFVTVVVATGLAPSSSPRRPRTVERPGRRKIDVSRPPDGPSA